MTCRACGGKLDPVFEMDPMPLAGAFAETREDALAADRYPLTWARCRKCGLVNVTPDVPDEVIFANYSYRASDVPALVRHHREFADWLWKHSEGAPRVLEIGCNDGVLLRQLPEAWPLVGVDPSDVARDAATGSYEFHHEPFTGGLGKFGLIVSSNSFAHFTAIGPTIEAVKQSLAPGGRVVIEVHDLDASVTSGQWDTIYHEHKVEWSLGSLATAFAMYGLRLVGHERLPLHGGLIRATFAHGDSPVSPTTPDFGLLRSEYAARRQTPAYLVMQQGGAAYGAAARASVYLNQTGLDLDYIVDGSPRRFGRFVPGIGTPIVPPDVFDLTQPGRTLITAWSHADDIRARHPGYDGWVTAW